MRLESACIGLLLGSAILLTGCGKGAMAMLTAAREKAGAHVVNNSSESDIRKMFQQANDQCPTRIDEYTTLVEVTIVDERNIEFHYKVNDAGKRLTAGLDPNVMRHRMVASIKNNEMAVAIAERDLAIHHIYEDRFGGHLLSYIISRDVLNGNMHPSGRQQPNPFAGSSGSMATQSSPQPPLRNASTQSEAPNLPTRIRHRKKTRSNPAGVENNPYFQS